MNKRFFTLMAAVMLAGSPFASEAFAAPTPVLISGSTVLGNGAKFMVQQSGSWVGVTSAKAKDNVTYQTLDPTATTPAVFEVRNYQSNALGVTFELYVDGQKFATDATGTSVDSTEDPVTNFTATNSGNYQLKNLTAINTAHVTSPSTVFTLAGANHLYTKTETYTQSELQDYNAKSTTFSFNATNLEGGDIFKEVQPIDLNEGALRLTDATSAVINSAVPGTYFATGAAADVAKLRGARTTADSIAAAKKLNFVYVKNAKYSIDALTTGEGYQLVKISGADFYADDANKRAKFANAAFLTITEADQLNNEGTLTFQVQPYVTQAGTVSQLTSPVYVAAIKASASDTKSYLTTVAMTGSRFTAIHPTLGANTYFAASTFLKKNGASIYNIYFTSGSPSIKDSYASEHHKYLTQTVDVTVPAFDLTAYAADEVDLSSPLAQWVVTGFDNKYSLTLQNRQTTQTLTVRLSATGAADVYSVSGTTDLVNAKAGSATNIVPLAGTSIKLIPATVSRNDGFLALSDEEMENGVKLSFSGKNAIYGKATFYAKVNSSTTPTALVPTTKSDDAEVLGISRADNDLVNVITYAYISANGLISSKADTLLVAPAYVFTQGTGTAAKNVSSTTAGDFVLGSTSSDYVLMKHMDGSYAMNNTGGVTAVSSMVANWKSIGTSNGTAFSYENNLYVPGDNFVLAEVVSKNADVDNATLPAISRHATFESVQGKVAFAENSNGVLEGILSAEPITFWLDTADSEDVTPHFYISKGIEGSAMRNFLYYPVDSARIWNESTALESKNPKYYLEGTGLINYKAIFRPAALVGVDTLTTLKNGKEVTVVAKNADAAKGQVNGLNRFQFGITLADEDVEGEYVIKSNAANVYLYSLNGRLGYTTWRQEALVVTLGEGDPTANEAIEAEAGVQVIGGQGVVTVQGAAGKVVTVANILGQTIANQVAASDNVTIAVPAGIVVVAVDGEATKVVVK